MRSKRFIIVLDLEYDEHVGARPNEDSVESALAHSTAREALSEALNCTVAMWLPTPNELHELTNS